MMSYQRTALGMLLMSQSTILPEIKSCERSTPAKTTSSVSEFDNDFEDLVWLLTEETSHGAIIIP